MHLSDATRKALTTGIPIMSPFLRRLYAVYAMQKRQEVLKRVAARSLRKTWPACDDYIAPSALAGPLRQRKQPWFLDVTAFDAIRHALASFIVVHGEQL
jgi:hypothetical protein